MKSEKQLIRKRYALLDELKDIRKTIYSSMITSQKTDINYSSIKQREKDIMVQINIINWMLNDN